jgi:hypothetical protein
VPWSRGISSDISGNMEACGEESSCCSYSLVEDINHNTMLMEVEQIEEKEASCVLPQEVWLLIFGNLSEKDLYTVAQVRVEGGRPAMSSLRRSGSSSLATSVRRTSTLWRR